MGITALAVLAGVLVLAPATGNRFDRHLVQRVEATAGAQPTQGADVLVEGKIANFIQNFYLSGANLGPEEIRQLYAPKVHYFGDQALTPAEIIADKRNYYRRWPVRQYQLLRDTLRISSPEGQSRVYEVTFDYTFDVARGGETSKGKGRTHLTLDLQLEGGMITRETGTVLERRRN